MWLSWSGGKDCAWALHEVRGEVEGLLATVSGGRAAVHRVPVALLRDQAARCGLPLREVEVPDPCPNAVYEDALAGGLRGLGVVAFGDLFLRDVRAYREALLARLGVQARFTLWGRATADLARAMVRGGLKARLVCVDTTLLPAAFLGRDFDEALLRDLPAAADPCGENGEFHTFAFAGPMFQGAVEFGAGALRTAGRFARLDVVPL
jgi:uncharacterized protein (TIGR00290 family)